MILNSAVLKFDMKIFVNATRLEIGQLFTRGHPCTLDTFLVSSDISLFCYHPSLLFDEDLQLEESNIK